MAKFTILAALALGVACDDKDDSVGEGDTDTDTDSDTDTDTDVIPDQIDVQWGTDSVVVDITGGSGDYEWGITETGKNAWEAEDCIGGTTAGYGPFCKTVTADSQTTFDCVPKADDMTNDTTLFCDVDENSLTYYFNAMDDSWCGVSGPDASYYAAQGCEAL
jgi:hypothetical protein